jgi:hypothetical protein
MVVFVVFNALNRREKRHLNYKFTFLDIMAHKHTDYFRVIDEVQHRLAVIIKHPPSKQRCFEVYINKILQI